MFADGFGEGTEDDPEFAQLLLEGGRNRDTVKDGVDRHPGEDFLLVEGNAQLLVRCENLGIDLVEAFELFFWGGEIGNGLVVDFGVVNIRPPGLGHFKPVVVSLEPPFQQPLGLFFSG